MKRWNGTHGFDLEAFYIVQPSFPCNGKRDIWTKKKIELHTSIFIAVNGYHAQVGILVKAQW